MFSSPLLDPYFISQYKNQVKQARKFGFIRKDVDVDAGLEPRFLKQALKDMQLETFWTPVGEDGVVPKATAAVPSAPEVTAAR